MRKSGMSIGQLRHFRFSGIVISILILLAIPAQGQLTSQDISQLEEQAKQDNWTFSVGENPATAYSLDQLCGLKVPDNWKELAPFSDIKADRELPAAFDWRDSTGCPPVRNQGGCGSCWAFGTVGALECNILIKDGIVVDLSEQWLVSCNSDGWDCGGGWWAHDYHQWKTDPCGGTGAVRETDFPYTATNGTCSCPYEHHELIDSWAYVGNSYSIPSVSSMKQAILDYGPISVAVYANSAMQAYTGGIFNGCQSGTVNHGVVLVGWDDNQGTNGVWIMRNSWGPSWGEEGGYMRMEYGCSEIGYGASYIVYSGNSSIGFDYPDGIPESVLPGESETFRVLISSIGGGTPVASSGQLHYSINGDPLVTVDMIETSPNNYRATLPVLSCGDKISFYVSAEEFNTGRYYDPDPANPNIAAAATEVLTVFQDNFETDKGWTVEGDATDGAWDRGVPEGLGERGDPPTDFDGSGQCYMTDNLYGNSDVDDGTTNLISPTFAISSGDAVVHYARWYSNDFGSDPNNDTMKVFISNDNGASWALVETIGPIEQSYGGWYVHNFWISDIITPTTQMKLKFEASDLINPSVVEAAVDDVSIRAFICNSNQPIIMTDTLPEWTAGVPYSQQLESTGGTGAHTWTDKYGDLAGSGLTLSSSGLISGVPTVSGNLSFTAVVTDDSSAFDEKILSIMLNEELQITTDALPDWTAGSAYLQPLQSSGGTEPLTWTDKNGDLLGTGFSLSSDGILSGTAVISGIISFTAHISDPIGAEDEQPLTLTINAPLEITTTSLPDWTEGVFFTTMLQSTGGTAPLTWSDKNGNLAGTGLTMTSAGKISGTPVTSGAISLVARLMDTGGAIEEMPLTLTVNTAVAIATTDLPGATAGADYSFQTEITGGTGTIICTDLNGDLDGTWLSLGSGGDLTGMPESAGAMSFTIEASDEVGSTDQTEFTLTVNDAVAITTESLPDGFEDEVYSAQLQSSGGTDPVIWSDVNGDLDGMGLSMGEDGLISGTPTSTGPIEFTASATDINGSSDESLFSFNIAVPYVCGDANSDESVNVLDITFLIRYLYSDGPAPDPEVSADVNSSGDINILDATHLINYLYKSGAEPNCP